MYTRTFDRQANMNETTMSEIMSLIRNSVMNNHSNLMNMLYGLFDGFDYTDSIMEVAKDFETTNPYIHKLLNKICTEVKGYPSGVTNI